MSIQTERFLNDDGSQTTPDQLEIIRLKKSNAALQQENAEFKKAIGDLQSRVLKLETEQRARWQKDGGRDADGNLIAAS